MDDLRRQLTLAGRRRAKARTEAARQSEAIRQLAHDAIEAGIPKAEVARLAQVSRPALDTMLKG